jgi:tRNA (adenine57-N1/adenine58-N1)-methyltransferase catalytic subunit
VAEVWTEGEVATLKRPGAPGRLVRLARGPQRIGEEGVLDLTDQIGRPPGGEVTWSGGRYRLVRPSLADLLGSVRRGAQIVTAKDAAELVFRTGVGPGDRVAEAGAGSGALTIALAHAVGGTGHVYSYDRRADFLAAARQNVERTGFADRVTWRERDVGTHGFDETELDAVLLDLPQPWEVAAAAGRALTQGGYLATYTPTFNQLERVVRALRDHGFDEVRALEVLERGLHVSDGGTRPEFEMLGHTGFLAVGRKVD